MNQITKGDFEVFDIEGMDESTGTLYLNTNAGDARQSAHWHYLGSSFGRSPYGNRPWGFGNRVDVYLVDGKVVGWVDAAPSTSANGGSGGGGAGR